MPVETTRLYRIENPNATNRHAESDVSHPDLVGKWFDPSLPSVTKYLRKSTQTFGKDARPINGARLIVAEVPAREIDKYHVSNHPIASRMDVEDTNYLIPRDGSVVVHELPLDPVIEDLKGKLGNVANLLEAQRRIAELEKELGEAAVEELPPKN